MQANDHAWQELQKIVGQLRQLRTWLAVPNEEASLRIEVLSPFRVDAMGRPAVHFCQKSRGQENVLILVNVIDRPVSFFLGGFPPEVTFLEEFFLNKRAVVLHGNIREELGPHEVRLFRYSS